MHANKRPAFVAFSFEKCAARATHRLSSLEAQVRLDEIEPETADQVEIEMSLVAPKGARRGRNRAVSPERRLGAFAVVPTRSRAFR